MMCKHNVFVQVQYAWEVWIGKYVHTGINQEETWAMISFPNLKKMFLYLCQYNGLLSNVKCVCGTTCSPCIDVSLITNKTSKPATELCCGITLSFHMSVDHFSAFYQTVVHCILRCDLSVRSRSFGAIKSTLAPEPPSQRDPGISYKMTN